MAIRAGGRNRRLRLWSNEYPQIIVAAQGKGKARAFTENLHR